MNGWGSSDGGGEYITSGGVHRLMLQKFKVTCTE